MWLLDLVLPPRCASCSAPAPLLCDACLASLRSLGPCLCSRCGAPTLWPVARCRECAGRRLAFATARAAVAYTGAARLLVGAWKEHGLRRAATLAAELVAASVPAPAADALTWVPADRDRLLERGHHPAERLARSLAERWGGVQPVPLLVRRRGGERQARLPRAERAANVRDAFVAVARPPRRIVLVDDVYTTGATAAAAAAALRRGGAARVDVVTFARAVRS